MKSRSIVEWAFRSRSWMRRHGEAVVPIFIDRGAPFSQFLCGIAAAASLVSANGLASAWLRDGLVPPKFGPRWPSFFRCRNEHEKAAEQNPKGVPTDEREVGKQVNDRKNCDHKRSDKSKVHFPSLLPSCLTHLPRAYHNHR